MYKNEAREVYKEEEGSGDLVDKVIKDEIGAAKKQK